MAPAAKEIWGYSGFCSFVRTRLSFYMFKWELGPRSFHTHSIYGSSIPSSLPLSVEVTRL